MFFVLSYITVFYLVGKYLKCLEFSRMKWKPTLSVYGIKTFFLFLALHLRPLPRQNCLNL